MKRSITDLFLKLLLVCLFAIPAYGEAAARNVSGRITDSGKQPLPGAAVLNKTNGLGVITDLDGKFTIAVSGSNDVLEISCLGFVTQELTVGKADVLNVTLEEDSVLLEDVVVVGYGTQRKASITGSVEIGRAHV